MQTCKDMHVLQPARGQPYHGPRISGSPDNRLLFITTGTCTRRSDGLPAKTSFSVECAVYLKESDRIANGRRLGVKSIKVMEAKSRKWTECPKLQARAEYIIPSVIVPLPRCSLDV